LDHTKPQQRQQQTYKTCPFGHVLCVCGGEDALNIMFSAESNTRHIKCAHLDVFYMSDGERRLQNIKYMSGWACISCPVEGRWVHAAGSIGILVKMKKK